MANFNNAIFVSLTELGIL